VRAQSELRSHSEPRPETEPAHTSTPEIAAPVVPETVAAERSRRRSTVREPVTQVLRDEGAAAAPPAVSPMPAAEPVVSSPAEDESSDRPRRSGWWSKRVLGRS
jgi:ribonuclease E